MRLIAVALLVGLLAACSSDEATTAQAPRPASRDPLSPALFAGMRVWFKADVQSPGHGAMVCENKAYYIAERWSQCTFTQVGEGGTVQSWTGTDGNDGGLVQVALDGGSTTYANVLDLYPSLSRAEELNLQGTRQIPVVLRDKQNGEIDIATAVRVAVISPAYRHQGILVRIMSGNARGRVGKIMFYELPEPPIVFMPHAAGP